MADNIINRIGQQVRDKIRLYNKKRTGLVIAAVIFIGILVFLPAEGMEARPARLSVFCSATLLLCSTGFVLSLRSSLLLFFAAISITGILLGLNQIHFKLFMILFLIDAGMVLISVLTGKAIIHSYIDENNKINRLATEATTDHLTRLLNRNGLEQAVETAWAFCKRDKKNVGVILADIDYFKSYNDTLGHLEGDNILKQVADSIENCFRRQTDIISRIGGDEFLIFLPDVNDDYMLETAQSLSLSIINLKVKAASENNPCHFLSVSMGVAMRLPQQDDLLIDLYKTVDEALYHAKKAGRNCIAYSEKIIQVGTSVNESFSGDILIENAACRDSGK